MEPEHAFLFLSSVTVAITTIAKSTTTQDHWKDKLQAANEKDETSRSLAANEKYETSRSLA
jgi:hypothetical protein